MKLVRIHVAVALFVTLALVSSQKVLEAAPERSLAAENDEQKLKFMNQGHCFAEAADDLSFSEACRPSRQNKRWFVQLLDFFSFKRSGFQNESHGAQKRDSVAQSTDYGGPKRDSGAQNTHSGSQKPGFWGKYQLFSFQDFLFDSSVLITEEHLSPVQNNAVKVVLPKAVAKKDEFSLAYSSIQSNLQKDLYDFINLFTQFYTRFYKSPYGKDASDWLFARATETVNEALESLPDYVQEMGLITVTRFPHSDFVQESVLVKIKGSSSLKSSSSIKSSGSVKGKTEPRAVVLGTHLDCINLLFPYLLRAPGVDDNATGTAVTFAVLKGYLGYLVKRLERSTQILDRSTQIHGSTTQITDSTTQRTDGTTQRTGGTTQISDTLWPVNDVEFHFYAAEEGGLLGSLDVFADKHAQNQHVLAMLQLDQLGYNELKENGRIGLISDFVSEDVFEFVKILIDFYLDVGYVVDSCGYGCSDHASAYKYGYPSGMVCESALRNDNKFTHSTLDTVDRIDFEWLEHFVRLGLAFVLELEAHQ